MRAQSEDSLEGLESLCVLAFCVEDLGFPKQSKDVVGLLAQYTLKRSQRVVK